MSTRPRKLRLAGLVSALALLTVSCASPPAALLGQDNPPAMAESGADGGSTEFGTPPVDEFALDGEDVDSRWDVSLAPDAVIVDFDAAAGLVESDPAEGHWVFHSAALNGSNLSVGSAMLVAGVGMGRVISIDELGGQTVIRTAEASLADVIDDGTISWDAALSMTEERAATTQLADPGMPETASWRSGPSVSPHLTAVAMVDAHGAAREVTPVVVDGNGTLSWEYTEGTNKYTFTLSARGASTEIGVEVIRSVQGRAALKYSAVGLLESVRASGHATYAGGSMTTAAINQDNIKGSMKLAIAAAGAGTSDIDFTLPGMMFKYVVMVGPVPVTIGMSLQLIGAISVPAEGSATFKTGFSYNGKTGIVSDGAKVEVDGSFGTMDLNPESADAAALIGSPVNAEFGVGFPRLSVSLFDQFVVPYIQPGFVIGSRLTWGPVCKSAYAKAVLVTGYDFTVLGAKLSSAKTEKVIKERTADQDGCSGT